MSAGSNKFGSLFQWSTFGESHGPAMGVVIDGCPAGVEFDEALLVDRLAKRRPGGPGTTARVESDQPEILSGVFQGKTLGTPIAVMVRNQNAQSTDYDEIKAQPRIGHADDLWTKKFGEWDHRGGGRASARETVNWVIAGAVAEMFCLAAQANVRVQAVLTTVGGEPVKGTSDPQLLERLQKAKLEGESFGAVIEVRVKNPPPLIGEPVFLKAKSEFTKAFMMINACSGVELGGGFHLANQKGTEVHKSHESADYGGVRGGMTTGETLHFRLAFKPTSSILDVAKKGRHDPCVAVRAVPVAEAMAWAVLADLILVRRLNQL